MSGITYDFEGIAAFTQQMQTMVGALDQERGDLHNKIQTLAATWQGSAAHGMQEAFGKVNTDIVRLHETLSNLHQAVAHGNNNMQDTEGQLKTSWGKFS